MIAKGNWISINHIEVVGPIYKEGALYLFDIYFSSGAVTKINEDNMKDALDFRHYIISKLEEHELYIK